MPAMQNPVPDWLKPENASVMDPTWVTAIRKLASLIGANDPQSQVGALMAPMEVGPSGGLAGVIQSLAKSLKTGGEAGQYAMRRPIVRRMESLHQTGAAMPNQANWAGNTHGLMQAVGGDQDLAERFLRLIGATSPNTSVPVNTREALSVFAHSLENPGTAMTVPQAQQLTPAKVTMAPSKVPNINNSLTGAPLSGDKVEAFSQLMLGRPRIPIDVHALSAAGAASDKFQNEIPALRAMMTKAEGLPARGSLTDSDIYRRVERAMADALAEIAPGVPTNESFATMWEGTRAAKGLKPQGGPIDILRAKGLLQDAAMLDPGRLRAALKTAGWTAPAIAAVLQATSATSPETHVLEPE